MLLRIALFLLFFPSPSFCQTQYRFDHLSIKNGLSENTVNCILKDKEGYYWLGTQDGLNLYDGYSVKIFRHDRNDNSSISDNFILSLLEDNSGNLWIGTRNGLNFYHKKSGRFTKVIVNQKEKSYFHNSIWSVIKDKDGNILFSNSYAQLVKIDKSDAREDPFSPIILKEKVSLVTTSDTTYFIANYPSKQITSYSIFSEKEQWHATNNSTSLTSPVLDVNKNEVLQANNEGLFLNQKNSKQIGENILPNKSVNTILRDRQRNIWIGTTEGLYVYEKGNLKIPPISILHSETNSYSLGSNNVQGLHEDRNGLIWIGTSEAGVSIYNPEKTLFSIFDKTSVIPLSSNSVWSIYQDRNELWIGTSNGLNHFTFNNASISGIYASQNKILKSETFFKINETPLTLCDNFVTSIIKDKKGNFWFGTHNGISVYNPTTKSWIQFYTTNSPLQSNTIFHLMSASDGKVWISTMDSFYSYDVELKEWKSFLSKNHINGLFRSGYIICTYEDSDGSVWVGSTEGIYHITNKGEKIAFYFSEEADSKSLSYNMGTSFLRDSKGRFWVATLGGGIDLLDEKTNKFSSFTKRNGLANDVTYSLQEDKKGNIWISTNGGLSCFNFKTLDFTNYTEKEGLAANEFTQNAFFKNAFGEFFYGSSDGLIVFDPDKFKSMEREIPIILSSLKVNYNSAAFDIDKSIDLFYDDKTVSFEFAAPDFKNQDKIQYSYQLEGFDGDWHIVPSANRIASYTNLPFGNYIFKVRIKIGSGENWQNKQLGIQVNVIPPFWLSTWFIFLEILVFILVIVLLVRYYSQRKLKKHLREIELQQKIYIERERISRDLHDNVGSNLTYITSSLDNISYKIAKEDKHLSQEKIDSLSDFTRSTMQQLRETIWAINKENVNLQELKEKIMDYCSKMTDAANIGFKMDYKESKNLILKPSLAINIYRIVQEAVNNAIKHSKASILTVTISESITNSISIEIADNGKGNDTNNSSEGYGMKNMNDRTKELNGEISIDSEKDKGTCIKLIIPIN